MVKRKRFVFFLCLPLAVFSQNIQVHLLGEAPAVFPATPQTAVPDALGKPFYYLAAKAAGLQVYDIQDPTQPKWATSLPPAHFNGMEVSNACQRGQYLYLALGNFFNTTGQKPGLAVVDVSDPLHPAVKDVWLAPSGDEGAASVLVEGDYAYLSAMTQGLFVLRIADPTDIQLVSQFVPDPNFPVPNPNDVQRPNARGMALRDTLGYLCYDAGGLRVLNIADKAHPKEIGRYLNPAIGKQQAFNNIALHGNIAYIAVDYCGLEVLDISQPQNPQLLGRWDPWQCELPANAWNGSPGHCNHIALDTAAQLVFLSSGQSELSIVDVSDPAHPGYTGGYGGANDNRGAWGMTLDGRRIFLTYIVAVIPFVSQWAGVKILDRENISAASEPTEAGSLKISPNPFSDRIGLEFRLDRPGECRFDLWDVWGNKVASETAGPFPAGMQHWEWQAPANRPAGLYLLRLSNGTTAWVVKE